MITLPASLAPVLEAIRRVGRPRLVGGCVRDALLGTTPGDLDIEVGGTDFDTLLAVLRPFGSTDVVGRSFGTIKLRRNGTVYDFSLPRRESKTGTGHRGFKVEPDPLLSDAEAAARRDFTINSMAWDPFDSQLIDPHGGQRDLQVRVLRHTSPAFGEDPLRVLRGMQLAARFDLTLAPETRELCRGIVASGRELPLERIWGEWDKLCLHATTPSRGLHVLRETGWTVLFPEIDALIDTPQEPEWHPEGDVFAHTCHCVDALVGSAAWHHSPPDRRRILILAVLAHDFGKPLTTVRIEKHGTWRWTSPRHASEGLAPTETFLARIGAPLRLAPGILPLVKFHLAHIDGGADGLTDAQLRRLARKLAPASIADLVEVMRADALGRPPLDGRATEKLISGLAERAAQLAVQDRAPTPLVQGRDLVKRGLKPGPAFAPIIAAAYEAQLEGAFSDEQSSSIWLDDYLKHAPL
ncbi:CCA tRNA nucleotidyltransferase [Synoicihabitans lomoniglobus]|uniref:Polynucleotide adenylyltransferase n=1 Tax=Synoicihabitans lomoniglobus TaxID=2909285 RepID=A0AAE9ZVM1_9BACT|nr:polynucleotide adenylyltransferase [Opitutaceae bacterium LMO-M01]WED63914.1 polynucleotide adenylyltransferase [Opitutaceae bacterium LMO-M01]